VLKQNSSAAAASPSAAYRRIQSIVADLAPTPGRLLALRANPVALDSKRRTGAAKLAVPETLEWVFSLNLDWHNCRKKCAWQSAFPAAAGFVAVAADSS